MSSAEPPLRPLLTQLCDALSAPERRRLVFLCGSLDPDHSLVTARDVLEAAVRSSERPQEALKEVLVRLGRLDLLRSTFHCGREEVERQRSSLSRYRVLMVELSDNMRIEDLDQFKFMLGGAVPCDRLERAKSFLDVITELEKQGHVSSERVELIETCMRDIGRVDLAKRVCTVTAPEQTPLPLQRCRPIQPITNCQQARYVQLLQSACVQTPPPPIQPLTNCQQARHMQLFQSGAGLEPQTLYRTQACSTSIEHYKLNTNPRGVCIIIDCVGHDGELLKQTFQTLGFDVVLHRWLCVKDCLSALRVLQDSPILAVASAFVCCVVSRGTTLHLLATDAQRYGVNLDTLREMFTRYCPVLAGKPKLFFIQRYSVPQPDEGRGYQHSEDLETDGPGVGHSFVPTDADVFWSHCWTSESQLQRGGHNSHYLRALTEALKAGRWHVLDLHTRVNAALWEHNQRNPSEQYHLELKHTLTKNLFLH